LPFINDSPKHANLEKLRNFFSQNFEIKRSITDEYQLANKVMRNREFRMNYRKITESVDRIFLVRSWFTFSDHQRCLLPM